MAFRADEAAQDGYQEAESYLIGRLSGVDEAERARSKEALREIVDQLGPVVHTYPTWHPLVSNQDDHSPETRPNDRCGYSGIDHIQTFVSGFITCPYGEGAQAVLDSVKNLPENPAAYITAERLDVKFYSPEATPVLVRCRWEKRKRSIDHALAWRVTEAQERPTGRPARCSRAATPRSRRRSVPAEAS